MIKRLYKQLSVITGILFLIGIYQYVLHAREIKIPALIEQIGLGKLLLGSLFYLLSHLMRGLRLAVMVGREDISLRSIIRTQYFTNGVNLILPFKLGEVFRLYEFHKLIKKYQISVSAIIAEKSIDFCFLFLGLVACFYSLGNIPLDLDFTIIACALITLLLLFTCFVVPENIKSFNLFIAKRYSSASWIRVLAFTSKVYTIIRNIKQIINEKTATLLVFTAIIWVLEVLAFIFLMKFLPDSRLLLLLAALVFLSIFIPSGSLGIGGVQLAFYCIYIIDRSFPFLELSFIYQIFLFFPAIIISMILFLWEIYPEVKAIWRKTSEQSTGPASAVEMETLAPDSSMSFLGRIYEVYRYFKMKANL